MKTLFKVLSQSEPVNIQTQSGIIPKSILVLQELNGRYSDTYVASLLGQSSANSDPLVSDPSHPVFHPGDIVWASLRFTVHEYNGRSTGTDTNPSKSIYQDIIVQEIITIPHY